MSGNNHKEFIRKKHIEYKKIGYVECPAFGHEKIYFNRHGFDHLIRKMGKLRSLSEQIRRTSLLQYAPAILSKTNKISEYSLNEFDGYPGQFWTFRESLANLKIKIIIRKLGNGHKHFFSIMDEI